MTTLLKFPRDAAELWSSRSHSPAVDRERADIIARRVHQISTGLAILTLFWIIVDVATVSWPQWSHLAFGRIAAGAAFAWMSIGRRRDIPKSGLCEVGLLVGISLAFFLYANAILVQNIHPGSLAVGTAYYYLPFIIAAGLSIFPLTLLESCLFGLCCIACKGIAIALWPGLLSGEGPLSTIWRLALIVGISAIAGASQLQFLLRLTEQASKDGLTGLLVRRVGEELIRSQCAYAVRNRLPFSVVFIDVDLFKSLNDQFGHEAGDSAIASVAAHLRQLVRQQDVVVRWGGEEFVIGLLGTNAQDAETTVQRLAASGIGKRPDGTALTASIGIAERLCDNMDGATTLIDLADQRMYASKRAGRNRYLGWDHPKDWISLK
jgi:diguanylate cyclase (GGDEF)-like protein